MNNLYKFSHLAKNIIDSNYRNLKEPYRITFILTYNCQLKCQMCNIWQKKVVNELTLAEIEKFFKTSNRFSWINLSGGEIFLRKDFLDIVDIIYKNCKRLYCLDFPTNGFKTDVIVNTVEKITSLYKIPKLLVTVSLDGPAYVHDRIRNVPESWNNAVKTFEQLRKFNSKSFHVFLGMTLQPDNADKFDETFQSVKRRIPGLEYNDFHINVIQCSCHYYDNKDAEALRSADNKQLWDALMKIEKLRKPNPFNPIHYLEKKYQKLAKTYLTTGKTPISCQALSASCFIDPTGQVYPCTIYDKPIGNLRDFDYDISKIWKTPFRDTLRKEINNGQCPQCWTPCEAYQSIFADSLPKVKK